MATPNLQDLYNQLQAAGRTRDAYLIKKAMRGATNLPGSFGIQEVEANDPGFDTGYGTTSGDTSGKGADAVYGYGKYGVPDKPLSQGTFGEAHDFGQSLISKTRGKVGAGADKGTSAVGAYQMIGSTMENYAKQAFGENWRDVPFTFENQQKVARRIYDDARKGNVSNVWPTAKRGSYKGVSFEEFSREILPKESGMQYDAILAQGSQQAPEAPGTEGHLTREQALEKSQQATTPGDAEFYAGMANVESAPGQAQAAENQYTLDDLIATRDKLIAQGKTEDANILQQEIAQQQEAGLQTQLEQPKTEGQYTLDDLIATRDKLIAQGNTQDADILEQEISKFQPTQAEGPAPTKSWVGEQVDAAYEALTGESRMTPEMERLPAVGDSPEMNELSLNAAKAGWSQMFGSEESQKQILQDMGGKISYDAKGNAIVDLPSGQYALNKPGLSPQDVVSGLANIAAFTPAAKAGQALGAAAQFAPTFTRAATTGLGSMLTEAGLQGITQAAGGEQVKPENVMLAGALGAGGEVLGAGASRLLAKQKPLFVDGVPEERLVTELNKLGLDFHQLPDAVRAELRAMPKDINPADAAAVALSRTTEVPLTTGQITQKRAQQALEKRQGKFAEMQEFQAEQSAKIKEGLTSVRNIGPGEQLGRSLQNAFKNQPPRTGPIGADPEFIKNMRKSGVSKNPRTITNEIFSRKTPELEFHNIITSLERGGLQGRIALDNLQGATALDLIESSFKNDVFQPEAFIKRMDEMGKNRLKLVFKNKPEELQKLQNFGQLAKKIKNTAGAGEDPTRLRGLVRGLLDHIPVIKYLGPVKDLAAAAVSGAKDKRALQQSLKGKPGVLKDLEEINQNYPAIANAMGLGLTMEQQRDDKLTIPVRPTMESRTE